MNEKQDNTSLRDTFAAHALVGLIVTAGSPHASGDLSSGEDASLVEDARCGGWGAELNIKDEKGEAYSLSRLIAEEAYEVADAMLRERGKGGSS